MSEARGVSGIPGRGRYGPHGATTRAHHGRLRTHRDRHPPRAARGRRGAAASDLTEPEDLQAPETFVHADLNDFDAVQRAVDGVDAVVHLGAISNEAPFEVIAGPNLHGVFHVFEACRRANVKRIVYASSNHASGMHPVGVPLDGSSGAPGRHLRRVQGLRRRAREHVRRALRALDRVPADRLVPPEARREARAVDLDQPRDGIRLIQAALSADDVGFAIVYGASANTRRWWPPDTAIGFVPRDDAEVFAAELDGPDYPHQGGPNSALEHGGWAT